MAGQPRRVYAPSMEPAAKAPPTPKRPQGAVVVFSVLVAFGSLVFLWSALFGAGTTPVVKAPTAPFKVAAPPEDKPTAEQPSLYDALEAARGGAPKAGAQPGAATGEAPAPSATAAGKGTPIEASDAESPPGLQPTGPYLVQLAALQSQDAAAALGPRLAKADPATFAGATFDVQRVERQNGVFFRVRAGYFADWAEASLFCKRMAAKNQDCIAVSR